MTQTKLEHGNAPLRGGTRRSRAVAAGTGVRARDSNLRAVRREFVSIPCSDKGLRRFRQRTNPDVHAPMAVDATILRKRIKNVASLIDTATQQFDTYVGRRGSGELARYASCRDDR